MGGDDRDAGWVVRCLLETGQSGSVKLSVESGYSGFGVVKLSEGSGYSGFGVVVLSVGTWDKDVPTFSGSLDPGVGDDSGSGDTGKVDSPELQALTINRGNNITVIRTFWNCPRHIIQ